MAHDLLSNANEATTGSSATAETSGSSSPATQHDQDAGAQYDDHEMDQLLENIDFQLSCLLELSPSIERCMEHDDAKPIPLPAVPDLSIQGLHDVIDTLRILKILEPRAPKELLDRLYTAKIRRDMHELHTDFRICTFDDCSAKYRVFAGAEWAHHEFSRHRFSRSWTCHVCQRVDVDESAWLGHLLAAHLIDLEGSEMVLASKLACQIHPRPIEQEKCSFCASYPAKTREDFEKHVGDHFQDACELIAAHSMERTEPQSSKSAAQSQSLTEEMDISLDDPLESFRSSRDVFTPDLLSQDRNPRISSPDAIGHSASIGSLSQLVMPNSLLNTGSQFKFPTSSIDPSILPPPKTARWQCGNCMDRPLMTLNYESHCSSCNRKYDVYSVYYDQKGGRILI